MKPLVRNLRWPLVGSTACVWMICGTAAASTGNIPPPDALGAEPSTALIKGWQALPDTDLAALRGGMDLGPLALNFAIERVVRINGEIVARTQLVLSELGRLQRGQLPDLAIVGNLATLIQIGENRGQAARSLSDQATNHANAAAGAAVAAGTDGLAALLTPSAGGAQAPGSSPVNSSRTDSRTDGSIASIAPGLVSAVAAANDQYPGRDESAAANAVARPGGDATLVLPSARPGAANGISFTIPMGGMVGASVLVSGLPNAALLSTAIQNAVQAARIDTETSISANLASLSALRSAEFAASLRDQAIASVRR